MTNELLHRTYDLLVRAPLDGAEERTIDVIASTDTKDSYDEVVVQDWDLKRYKKNPVVLYGHNSYGKPIGFATAVKVEDGKLTASLKFVTAEANPEAEQVWQLLKQGALRAVSVGFRAKKAKYIEEADVFALSGCELYEISVVSMPANPDAVVLEARSAETKIIRALAAPKENTMDQLLKALGAATEAEALNVVASLQRVRSSVLAATGASTDSEADGRLQALKQASSQLAETNAKLAGIEKSRQEEKRASLIDQARRDGKLAPSLNDWAKSADLAAVEAFLAVAPTIPQFAAKDLEQPKVIPAGTTWQGKSYNELTPSQKHALHNESPELFEAMRTAAAR